MGAAALSFRLVSVVGVMFAATAGHLAVPALRIVGGWLAGVKRRLGVLMGSTRAALANARRRFG
ncbi:hypothetical protein CQ13_09275 [Bradyrhizobium retamae]|uniref:Uncharacterized protein n=1 Tax=Bradyrhizobium retamae TaxID=1300035 RepID=A0A0R3MIB0_9BRAD|nr:hypothetical protein CQ13_09275 [Bradyrhizobium retamae]